MEINSPNYSCPVIAEFKSSVGTALTLLSFLQTFGLHLKMSFLYSQLKETKKEKKKTQVVFFSVLGFITNNFFTGQMPSSCLQWESGKLGSPVLLLTASASKIQKLQ